MWRSPAESHAQDHLKFDRWKLVLAAIDALSMAIVLVRTYKHSKFPYLYTCAAMMFLAAIFNLLSTILFNWFEGCKYFYSENEKCG
jgi:hypothetical protein